MSVVAVLDFGKTNKKIALVDRRLRLVAERSASIPPRAAADGLLEEDTDGIWDWTRSTLRDLAHGQTLAGLAVTTHGATYALLGADGRLTTPVVAYDSPLDATAQARLDADFYARVGDRLALQDETGTCDLPLLINPAKSLCHLQRLRPAAVNGATRLLQYPQYWSWLLTGVAAADTTYSANHSFLYDPHRDGPSSAARALGVDRLVAAPLRLPCERLGHLRPELAAELGLPRLPVAVGIHDSNAAFLPYLLRHDHGDFLLNSTGTWCVAMRRCQDFTYAPGELGQTIIFNRDAFGRPVKVSFLMGGQDHARYRGLMGCGHLAYDAQRLARSLAHDAGILPGASASLFPGMHGGAWHGERTYSLAELAAGHCPPWWSDHGTALDLLDASLALQSVVAFQRAGLRPGTRVFIEGGFRNNRSYLALLAALLPHNPVACTDLAQATSVGAALCAWSAVDGGDPRAYGDAISITEQPIAAVPLANLDAYALRWSRQLG